MDTIKWKYKEERNPGDRFAVLNCDYCDKQFNFRESIVRSKYKVSCESCFVCTAVEEIQELRKVVHKLNAALEFMHKQCKWHTGGEALDRIGAALSNAKKVLGSDPGETL